MGNPVALSRTIKFTKAGGPDVLEFVETAVPAPGPTEVRIKVKAIGINRAESMWRHDDVYRAGEVPGGPRLRGGRRRRCRGPGRHRRRGRRRGQRDPVLLDEPVHDLRRGHPRAGLRRREASEVAVVRRGRVDLDDVRDGLRRAHRGRQGDQGRFRHDPGGFQQRRTGGDPDRQLRRRDVHRADAHSARSESSCSKPAPRM